MTNQTGARPTEAEHHGAEGACDALGPQPGMDTPADWSPSHDSPPSAPLLTVDEFDRINAAIWDRVWDDPTRLNDCLIIALGTLGAIGLGEARLGWSAEGATQAMRRMMQRVLAGEVHIEVEDHR